MINCGEEMIVENDIEIIDQSSSQPNNNEDNNVIKMEKGNQQSSQQNDQNQNNDIMRVHQTIQSKYTSHIITNSSLFYPTFDLELIENYGQMSSIYYQYHGFFISNSTFDCIEIPVFISSSISSSISLNNNEIQSSKDEKDEEKEMKSKSNLVLNMFKQVR